MWCATVDRHTIMPRLKEGLQACQTLRCQRPVQCELNKSGFNDDVLNGALVGEGFRASKASSDDRDQTRDIGQTALGKHSVVDIHETCCKDHQKLNSSPKLGMEL
jgi:hypothetical protein